MNTGDSFGVGKWQVLYICLRKSVTAAVLHHDLKVTSSLLILSCPAICCAWVSRDKIQGTALALSSSCLACVRSPHLEIRSDSSGSCRKVLLDLDETVRRRSWIMQYRKTGMVYLHRFHNDTWRNRWVPAAAMQFKAMVMLRYRSIIFSNRFVVARGARPSRGAGASTTVRSIVSSESA